MIPAVAMSGQRAGNQPGDTNFLFGPPCLDTTKSPDDMVTGFFPEYQSESVLAGRSEGRMRRSYRIREHRRRTS